MSWVIVNLFIVVRRMHYSWDDAIASGEAVGVCGIDASRSTSVAVNDLRRTARIVGEFLMRGFGCQTSSFRSTVATTMQLAMYSSGCLHYTS